MRKSLLALSAAAALAATTALADKAPVIPVIFPDCGQTLCVIPQAMLEAWEKTFAAREKELAELRAKVRAIESEQKAREETQKEKVERLAPRGTERGS